MKNVTITLDEEVARWARIKAAEEETAFIKGMKELRLTVVYRNGAQLDDHVARNYETMGKLLKQMGFAK